jgi:hypothetical protein
MGRTVLNAICFIAWGLSNILRMILGDIIGFWKPFLTQFCNWHSTAANAPVGVSGEQVTEPKNGPSGGAKEAQPLELKALANEHVAIV